MSVPALSVAERDRRYRLVRAAMAEQGIDVLLLPANHSRWEQMMADSRYLTSIGGFGTETLTIFPAFGEVTAYVFNRADWWRTIQDWVTDVRDGRNRWAENVIERLGELGFKRGRIGVSGLSGLLRAPDGLFPYETVERIRQAFPGAELANATQLIQDIRAVKSAEELALMRNSMKIIEMMIDAMLAAVRVGATERRVYADMVQTLVANGGELPSLLILGAGPGITHGSFVPRDRHFEPGDLVLNEIEARCGGYSAQALSPLSIGPPDDVFADLMKASLQCFHELIAAMKPGVCMAELLEIFARSAAAAGSGYEHRFPIMNARGLGDESPAIPSPDEVERYRDISLREGMTFVLKPGVGLVGDRRQARIGDTVVVTPSGGVRLGRRPLELGIIG